MKGGKCGKGWEGGAGGKCVRKKRKTLVSDIGKGGWGGKYTSPGKRLLLAGGAAVATAGLGLAGMASFKSKKTKQSEQVGQSSNTPEKAGEDFPDPWNPLSSKKKTSQSDRDAFASLGVEDVNADPWKRASKKETPLKRLPSKRKMRPRNMSSQLSPSRKQARRGSSPVESVWQRASPSRITTDSDDTAAHWIYKPRQRLDARTKINGQCGKGWTEGPGDKCIRPKGKFDLHYGQKEPGLKGAIKHGVKKVLFGSGDVEYNRHRSAGATQQQAFVAGTNAGVKGLVQDFVMGGGSRILPGGKVGGAVYRRSRDAGQGRVRAGAKGLAAGLSINVPLAIAITKGIEKLREHASQQASQQSGGGQGRDEYSEKFANAKRRSPITEESLKKSRKKQQRKNHPDRVSKLQEPEEWDRRNRKAQRVEHSFNKASRKLGVKLDSLARARLRAYFSSRWS